MLQSVRLNFCFEFEVLKGFECNEGQDGFKGLTDLKDVDMLKGMTEYFHRTRVRSLFTLATN